MRRQWATIVLGGSELISSQHVLVFHIVLGGRMVCCSGVPAGYQSALARSGRLKRIELDIVGRRPWYER